MCGTTLLLLGLSACGSDSTSKEPSPLSVAPTPTVVDSSPTVSTPGLTAYCERVLSLLGEHPEAYVGSSEHRADVEALIEVAPAAVIKPLGLFSEFLGSGAITAADPESNVIDNWPSAVQQAIVEITAFNGTSC